MLDNILDNYRNNKCDVATLKKFSNLKPYINLLKKQGILNRKNILDVGCGPGEWMFAATELNPNASIVGIDIYERSLNFAMEYMQNKNIKNCKFLKMSYENLLDIFPPASFDVIMCNSTIEYIDEKKALYIFSRLLKKEGLLLMFCNPGPGFYVHELFSGIKKLDVVQFLFGCKVLVFGTLEKYLLNKKRDYFVTITGLKKKSEKFGLVLTQIETKPTLCARNKFLGLTHSFSCKGLKIDPNRNIKK